ncbi:hypothetical protein L209DRAFT_767470 [Thermothelomyces heterothallicus CBS 203.75]
MASPEQPALGSAADASSQALAGLVKRIDIPYSPNSPPGLVQALTLDPWTKSGKYGLGWTYFAIAVGGLTVVVRIWHYWQDKIRQAIYKQEMEQHFQKLYSLDPGWDRTAALATAVTTAVTTADTTAESGRHFFPEEPPMENKNFRPKAHFSSVGFVNDTLALFRWVFYRPIPDIVWRKHRFTFSSLAVLGCVFIALAFVTVFSFLQQPLYWQSIRFGSPPLAIRSGMIAVAMTPWIFATSTKANILTIITGIGPERLNVFHRWLGYLCLFMSLIHMIPFYVQPVWEDGGMQVFQKLFPPGSGIIYGSGIACLVPLCWLCVASLPVIRRTAYELFSLLHAPVGYVYLGVLFWHTKNFLMSWGYLYASVAILVLCNILRLLKLNWARPWRMSWLIGDEAAINIMTENAIKITIPTRMRWKPGQYVYLRMPGISLLENHPFTISSLCSEDFPSEYGEEYRDCVLVFRPYGGFTRKVLETAIEKGPFHTYRAFLDGPYGGMRRELAAFDTCILIAGGSGITSLMSQLLNLIKRMRDGKAITKKIVVVWALKRLEAMDWFREELRICRESAPPESVTCKFFVTAAVRQKPNHAMPHGRAPRPLSNMFHDKLDGFEALRRLEGRDGDAKGSEPLSSDGHSGGAQKKKNKKMDGEFHFPPLGALRPEGTPHFNYAPPAGRQRYSQLIAEAKPRLSQVLSEACSGGGGNEMPSDVKSHDYNEHDQNPEQAQANTGATTESGGGDKGSAEPVRAPELAHLRTDGAGFSRPRPTSTFGPPSGFDFGFPETPTEFQRSLMRFAFPVPHEIDGGWSVEYGRPDLGYMLREWATGGPDGRGILGRRTAVFVCGPPSMRVGVANTVAALQAEIWGDDMLEEIFLHTENYAL